MMTQPGRILEIAVFVATLLLLPLRAAAQTGTVTDDAFLSINPTTQQVNANGYGMVLIVAGSSAAGSPGTTTTFLKFQLQSSLPPNVAATNVAKATLKLFLPEDRKLCLGLQDCQKCQLAVFLSFAIGMATGKKVRAYQPEWKV